MVAAPAQARASVIDVRSVERAPVVLALLAAFVIVWTLYGAISGASSAVHHDTAEAYVWGREFQLGYYKHPPLWAWIAGAWFSIAPHQDWAFRLLSMINAAFGLWGSWRLIGNFAQGRQRLAATILLLLTPCYTFLAYKYNANSIFLSLWPWTLHYFVRSFDGGRLRDAVLFGAFMAAATLSKYFAVILALTCLLAAVSRPTWRGYFTSLRPYVSVAVAAVLLAPHIWWLARSDFGPFHYFGAEAGRAFLPVVSHAAGTVAAVVALHLIVLGVILSCAGKAQRPWAAAAVGLWRTPRARMAIILALAPIVLSVMVALSFRNKIDANMMIGTFSLYPLLLVWLIDADEERLFRRAVIGAVAVSAIALALSPIVSIARMRFAGDPDVVQPRAEVAQIATRIWRTETGAPLTYVAGSEFYANATSFYSPDHPHVFIEFNPREAPWIRAAALARAGLLIVCDTNDAACLENGRRYWTAQSWRTHFTLAHAFAGLTRAPVRFMVQVDPPAGAAVRQR